MAINNMLGCGHTVLLIDVGNEKELIAVGKTIEKLDSVIFPAFIYMYYETFGCFTIGAVFLYRQTNEE